MQQGWKDSSTSSLKFETVELTDGTGEDHEFHFRTNLFGPGEITGNEFGHMLMTFEGWQFKMLIADKSEAS